MSDELNNEEIFDEVIKDIFRRIERIEQNIDYAKFDIQEQRIEVLERGQNAHVGILARIHEFITEDKKEIAELRENCKMCKDCNLYPFRDSGGEKAGSDSSSLNHPKDVRDGTLNQNSKPPEPNKNDYLLRHYIIDSDEPNRCVHRYLNEFGKCVHCGILESEGKIIDCRCERHILVKRDKIEFWRKELLNSTNEVLQSMRKVLGID